MPRDFIGLHATSVTLDLSSMRLAKSLSQRMRAPECGPRKISYQVVVLIYIRYFTLSFISASVAAATRLDDHRAAKLGEDQRIKQSDATAMFLRK